MSPLSLVAQSAANYGFTKREADAILGDQYGRIDFIMERFLLGHCGIAFVLAFVYSTWIITVPVALSAFLMFAICRRAMPRTLLTRCVAGISLQAFVALHIYQLHGLPEMHFFFFTAQTMMILYYDARAFWPGTFLIIAQHVAFAALTNAGYHVDFFPDTYISIGKQFFHYAIGVGQVGVCAYWAHYLRQGFLRDHKQRLELLYANVALREARSVADRASAIKSQFLANMSHEIRTPLNGVIGLSTLLEDMEMGEICRDYVHCIKASGETLLALINDILDLSKIEAGKISIHHDDFSLEAAVDDVLATMHSKAIERNLEFLAVIEPSAPRKIRGDPDRIKQIWINLIGNALKFTKYGSVVLRIGWDQIEGSNGRLICAVEDTGIGIPEHEQQAIFDCFSQVAGDRKRETGGTGLGLTISRQLAEAMGGELTVESVVWEGSTFICRLPAEAVQAIHSQPAPLQTCLVLGESQLGAESLSSILKGCGCSCTVAAGDEIHLVSDRSWDVVFVSGEWLHGAGQELPSHLRYGRMVVTTAGVTTESVGSQLRKPFRHVQVRALLEATGTIQSASSSPKPLLGRRFLVVEDNAVNQRILSEMLRRNGGEVDLAENGELGLAAMQAQDYDLVFMDCQMPVMDGFECTRLIRAFERGSNVRRIIVATTANAMQGDQEECLRHGMDDYVSKPITRSALLSAIERNLDKTALQAAA